MARWPEEFTVFVVDDDLAVRDALALMLGLEGFRVALFADAESFLRAYGEAWSGCAVVDLRLPGMSGVELQAELQARGSRLPFVIITAHGDVATARRAFQAHAVDFLEKPYDHAQLRAAIETSFALEDRRIHDARARSNDAALLATLTPREREVLEQVALGAHAKAIAARLGISPRTVEVHKTHIMGKLGVRNVAEVVRFAIAAGPLAGPGGGGSPRS